METASSRCEGLIKRLRSLWVLELFNSFFLPAVALWCAYVLETRVGPFTIYGCAAVAWLLWQGAAFWWLKLRALKSGSAIRDTHVRVFARLKWINWLVLAGGAVLLGMRLGALEDTPSLFSLRFDVFAGSALYALAVLEHVNYYYYQLMYDNLADWRYLKRYKKLKKSHLSRMLGNGEESAYDQHFRPSSE